MTARRWAEPDRVPGATTATAPPRAQDVPNPPSACVLSACVGVWLCAPQILATLGNQNSPTMEHLACFVPGMLALGAFHADGSVLEPLKQRHLQHAKALMYTCWQMYASTPTGLSPDEVQSPGLGPITARVRWLLACAPAPLRTQPPVALAQVGA